MQNQIALSSPVSILRAIGITTGFVLLVVFGGLTFRQAFDTTAVRGQSISQR